MIAAEILGVGKAISFLNPPGMQDKVRSKVLDLAVMLRDAVKNNYLTGQVLHVRTGRLRRSITSSTENGGFTGVVGTNVEYARIQEFGGTTKPHDILPVHAKALFFKGSGVIGPMEKMTSKMGRYLRAPSARAGMKAAFDRGEMVFAKAVHHPGSKIPEHSFLRAALRDLGPEIRAQLEDAVRGGFK